MFLKVINFLSLALLFINIVLYSIGFIKQHKAYYFLYANLISIFIIQVVMFYYSAQNMNNHFLSNYYLFINFSLLSCFFYYLFKKIDSPKRTLIKYLSTLIIIGLITQYVSDFNMYFVFNPLGLLISSSIITFYAVLYLYELLTQKVSYLYTTVGIFIYFTCSSVIFASASSIVSFNSEINLFIWKVNSFLFIVYQLLISWEWIKNFSPKPIK
jgi:hypothetical protein